MTIADRAARYIVPLTLLVWILYATWEAGIW